MRLPQICILVCAFALFQSGCGGDSDAPGSAPHSTPTIPSAQLSADPADAPIETTPVEVDEPPPLTLPETYADLLEPNVDDLDKMVKRRTVRVLVVHSKLFYFLDQGQQRGLTYDALQMIERDLNRKVKSHTLKVSVGPIPTARDQLLAGFDLSVGFKTSKSSPRNASAVRPCKTWATSISITLPTNSSSSRATSSKEARKSVSS